MEEKNWIRIRVSAACEHLDTITAIMSMIDNALMIEDFSDVEKDLDGVYGDLIDEDLLKQDRTTAAVSVFVPDEKSPREAELYIRARLDECGIDAEVTCSGVCEDDWADSWKKYYKPIKTGKRLVIVPVWETYDPAPEEITVLMDPGMAFGTGTHETTRLVIGMLQDYMFNGAKMLDVGTGSGILSIVASKLGAEYCGAYDLDPDAVRVAKENTEKNGVTNVECGVSDLLKSVKMPAGGFTLVCANIVADIIVRMLPELHAYMAKNTVCILSGIIETAEQQVLDCLAACGYKVVERRTEKDWVCLAVTLK